MDHPPYTLHEDYFEYRPTLHKRWIGLRFLRQIVALVISLIAIAAVFGLFSGKLPDPKTIHAELDHSFIILRDRQGDEIITFELLPDSDQKTMMKSYVQLINESNRSKFRPARAVSELSFVDPQSTGFRKFTQPYILSHWLRHNLSEDQIWQLLLQRGHFGYGNYGTHAASRNYFDKDFQDLLAHEVAFLALMLASNEGYRPYDSDTDMATELTKLLELAEKKKYISAEQSNAAFDQQISLSTAPQSRVQREIMEKFWFERRKIIRKQAVGSIVVDLTIDTNVQSNQHEWVKHLIRQIGSKIDAVRSISIDQDGAILDYNTQWVGFNQRKNFQTRPLEIASAFAALVLVDEGVMIPEEIEPSHFKEIGSGRVNRQALKLGYSARAMNPRGGFFGKEKSTNIELAASLTAMNNGGYRVDPFLIKAIRGRKNFTYDSAARSNKRVIPMSDSEQIKRWLRRQNLSSTSNYSVGQLVPLHSGGVIYTEILTSEPGIITAEIFDMLQFSYFGVASNNRGSASQYQSSQLETSEQNLSDDPFHDQNVVLSHFRP